MSLRRAVTGIPLLWLLSFLGYLRLAAEDLRQGDKRRRGDGKGSRSRSRRRCRQSLGSLMVVVAFSRVLYIESGPRRCVSVSGLGRYDPRGYPLFLPFEIPFVVTIVYATLDQEKIIVNKVYQHHFHTLRQHLEYRM